MMVIIVILILAVLLLRNKENYSVLYPPGGAMAGTFTIPVYEQNYGLAYLEKY